MKRNKTFEVTLTDGTVYKETPVSRSRLWAQTLAWEHWSEWKDMKVLEIGPRYKRWFLRKQLELNGCEYYSITDGKNELRRGNVVRPPEEKITTPGNFFTTTNVLTDHFEEDFFDAIIGIESFEHWGDRLGGNKAYKIGVEQCSRVLKSGGIFAQEVPVVSHGHEYFLYEKWDELDAHFPKDTWGEMQIVEKGRDLVSDTSHDVCKHKAPSNVKCGSCCWQAVMKWELL